MVGFQGSISTSFGAVFALAMTSTSLAAAVSAAVGANSELALQFLVVLFMPQLLFVGYFVIPELIPAWVRWLEYLAPAMYSVRIMMVDEFYQNCGTNGLANLQCSTLLSVIGAMPEEVWWYWIVLASQFIGLRILALVLLRVNAMRFY